MTEAQAIELIDAQMVAQWPTVSGGLPLALENEALPTADSFAMLTIKHTVADPYTAGPAGSRRVERRGWIFVKLWGPADAGRKGISTLADGVRSIFEGQQLSTGSGEPVTISTGLTQEVGVDGRYYMVVVSFALRYYGTF